MATGMLGSNALADFAGPWKDFSEKLTGPERDLWWAGFKRFLRKENPWVLKLLRQMRAAIGGVSKDDLLRRVEAESQVSNWARDIYGKPEVMIPETPTEVEFGWIAIRDLGFEKDPTTLELYARIREVGDLCSRGDGPHIRVADQDQPRGTAYWVPVDPITDSGSDPVVWYLWRSCDGGRGLRAGYAGPEDLCDLDRVVVIRLRK